MKKLIQKLLSRWLPIFFLIVLNNTANAQGVVCPAGVNGCGGGGSSATASNISDAISCTDVGGDDTYVCDPTTPVTSLTNLVIAMKVSTSNTGAATVNVSGLGVKDIKVAGASIADPATNDIRANSIVLLKYDGTQFLVLSRSGITGAGTGDMVAANNLSDVASASTARTNLGLAIGTNVQAYDGELAALAGLTSAADKLPYWTGAGTAANADLTTFGRSLIDDANAAAGRTTLGVVIGTDVQAQNGNLAALAGLTFAADKCAYFTGTSTATTMDCTTAGRAMLSAASAAAQTALLSSVVGDSGAGGTKGLVPAPGAGDAAADKYLKANGTWSQLKTTLSANADFYVRTDGSDSNTGLANTAGAAFLTLQGAWNAIVTRYNTNSKGITINVADGTYGCGLMIINLPEGLGQGSVYLVGNTTTPSNVVVSTAGCTQQAINISAPIYIEVKGFELTGIDTTIKAQNGAYVAAYSNKVHAGSYSAFTASSGASIDLSYDANTVVYGNSTTGFAAFTGGIIYLDDITFSGTPVYSQAVFSSGGGIIYVYPSTITGSTSGPKYFVDSNGLLNDEHTSGTFGSSAGTLATGGNYNGDTKYHLESDTNFYVRTDGSDSNSGLANTAGGAWLTLQGAYDNIVNNYNLNGHVATINIADGTYSGRLAMAVPPDGYNGGSAIVEIKGNIGTPSNVVITASVNYGGTIECALRYCPIGGIKISNTGTTDAAGIVAVQGAYIYFYAFDSGSATYVAWAFNGGYIELDSGTVSSSVGAIARAAVQGTVMVYGTMTLVGTPAFSIGAVIAEGGGNVIWYPTVTGSATGPKASVAGGSMVDNSTTLPGSTGIVMYSNAIIGDSAPTVSSCGGSPSITGSATSGKVTIGSGSVTSCTLTFANSFSSAPQCFANDESSVRLVQAVGTTTTVTLASAASMNGEVVSYFCRW